MVMFSRKPLLLRGVFIEFFVVFFKNPNSQFFNKEKKGVKHPTRSALTYIPEARQKFIFWSWQKRKKEREKDGKEERKKHKKKDS
jgi:hypothetical protein